MASGPTLLNRFLTKKKIGKRALAREAGINPGYLCSLASGKRRAGLEVATRLEEATGGYVPRDAWRGFKPRAA